MPNYMVTLSKDNVVSPNYNLDMVFETAKQYSNRIAAERFARNFSASPISLALASHEERIAYHEKRRANL